MIRETARHQIYSIAAFYDPISLSYCFTFPVDRESPRRLATALRLRSFAGSLCGARSKFRQKPGRARAVYEGAKVNIE